MLSSLALYTYELPLSTECSCKGAIRTGVIIESPEFGIFAEASPLPGYSKESPIEVLQELEELLKPILTFSKANHLEHELVAFLQSSQLSPSAAFALYALFQQIYFPLPSPYSIPLRRYIDIPYKNPTSSKLLIKQIEQLSSSDVVKIKLGSYPVTEAITLLHSALKHSSAALHLDINQKWSLKEVLTFCNAFPKGSFASLEDPVQHPSDLMYFAQHSLHPIALDNLVRNHTTQDFLSLPNLYSLEFKPTIDMHKLLDTALLETLHKQGIHVNFSSAYETSVGIAAIGRLGAKFIPSSYLGIDTLGVFTQEILSTPLHRDNNHFILHHLLHINKKHLRLHATASLSR